MAFHVQILTLEDRERVLAWATDALKNEISDETERTFASWRAAWRPEALDHYLKLGWCFGVFERGDNPEFDVSKMEFMGFSLIQPFLFFRGQTQTLWVEYVDAANSDALNLLVDYAIRMGRDKHIQRVLFSQGERMKSFVMAQSYGSQAQLLKDGVLEVRTTKG